MVLAFRVFIFQILLLAGRLVSPSFALRCSFICSAIPPSGCLRTYPNRSFGSLPAGQTGERITRVFSYSPTPSPYTDPGFFWLDTSSGWQIESNTATGNSSFRTRTVIFECAR